MSAPALYLKLVRLAAPTSGAPAPERAVARRKLLDLRKKHPEIMPARAFVAGSTAGARGAWGVLLLLPEGTITEHKGALAARPELNAAWCELVAIGAAVRAWLDTGRPDPLVILAPSWAISTIEGRLVARDRYQAIVERIRTVLEQAKGAELEVRLVPLGEHCNLAERTARAALEAA
jgi:hypothetical protein